MGNNQNKPRLRKSQSVPDTQVFSLDPLLVRNKSRSSHRLVRQNSERDVRDFSKIQYPVPLSEALFLPEFPIRRIRNQDEYEVIKVIAKGAYGNVIKVQRGDEKRFQAMKILSKTQIILENAIQQCKDEAVIQSMLGHHPFIVQIVDYWQSKNHLYMVLTFVEHGDMFSLWNHHGSFSEKLVCYQIAELAVVLNYLHRSGIIYRDLKWLNSSHISLQFTIEVGHDGKLSCLELFPQNLSNNIHQVLSKLLLPQMENIMFDTYGHVQLIDFGLAKWLQRGQRTRTICGTLQYMAPEVLAVYPYGHTADWWSLGILMYTMLAGKYPIDGATNHIQMAQKVFECDYLLPAYISDAAQDVVNRLCTKSPHRRLTDLFSLQNLPFFRGIEFNSLIEKRKSLLELVEPDFFSVTSRDENSSQYNGYSEDEFKGFDSCVWNLPPDARPVYV